MKRIHIMVVLAALALGALMVYGEVINYDTNNSGTAFGTSGVNYVGARNLTEASTTGTTQLFVGQTGSSGTFQVWRTFLSFDLSSIPTGATIDSMKILFTGISNSSDVDFLWFPAPATFGDGAIASDWYNDFTGWVASGIYLGVAPFSTLYVNSSTYSTSPDSLALNAAAIDSAEAHIGGTLRMVLLSFEDYGNSDPGANNEYVRYGSYKLTIALGPLRPQNFVMTPIDADSVAVSWEDWSDETGFRLVNIADTTLVAESDTLAAGTTSARIGGLNPNAVYEWAVEAIGGTVDGQLSDADSTYTDAAVPGTPTLSFPASDSMNVKIDVNGNPSYTKFAIRAITSDPDTFFVDATADTLVNRGEVDVGDTAYWDTYAGWGSGSGVTVSVDVGREYEVAVIAKSTAD